MAPVGFCFFAHLFAVCYRSQILSLYVCVWRIASSRPKVAIKKILVSEPRKELLDRCIHWIMVEIIGRHTSFLFLLNILVMLICQELMHLWWA